MSGRRIVAEPNPADVSDEDQRRYRNLRRHDMPTIIECTCDAAPYLHLADFVPDTDIKMCFVVQLKLKRITMLRITGGKESSETT